MADATLDPKQQGNRRRFTIRSRRRTPIEIRYRIRREAQSKPQSSANGSSTPVPGGGLPGSSTPVGGQPTGLAPTGNSTYDTPGNQPDNNFGAPERPGGEDDETGSNSGGSDAYGTRASSSRDGGRAGGAGLTSTSQSPGSGSSSGGGTSAGRSGSAGRGGRRGTDGRRLGSNGPLDAAEAGASEENGQTSEANEEEQPGAAPAADEESIYDEPGNAPSDAAKTGSQPAGESGDDSEPDREDLADKEEAADSYFDGDDHDGRVGRGYKKSDNKPGFLRRQLGKRYRIFLISGSGVIVIGLSLLFFTLLAPLKILHIVNNLQSHFYAAGENAVQRETDALFSDYVKKYVLPAVKNCPGEISKSCNPITGGGLVSQLFKGWRNAKLEEKLASDYGLEFKYVHGSFWIKTPGMSGNGASLGSENDPNGFMKSGQTLDEFISKSDDPEFKRVGRAQLRQAYKDAIASETKWKQVMYRFKAGKLLAQKYGLKRCIIACTSQDNFADWKDAKTKAAKLVFIQRVITPRSQMIGVVLACIIDGCDGKTTSDGKTVTAFDDKVQKLLDEASAKYGVDSVASMVKAANDISKRGYQKYILDQAIGYFLTGGTGAAEGDAAGKLAAQEAATEVSDKVLPIVGWVKFAAKMVSMGQSIGPAIRDYAYVTNAATMVNTYMIYRTFADETKTGHVDANIVGSFVKSLGPGDKTSGGGRASAEETPLYHALIDAGSPSSSIAFSGLLGGNAYALSNSPNYLCNDGKPVPAGSVICPEYNLNNSGNSYADSISSFFKSSYMWPVTVLAGFINKVSGWLSWLEGQLASLVVSIPPFSTLGQVVAGAAAPVMEAVAQHVVPNIASDNPGGGMNFVLAAGGADVSGNDYTHEGLGGQALSNQQASAILEEQNQQQLQSYQSKSFVARLFDTSSDYSLASKVVMAAPDSLSSAGQSIAGIFTDPLGKLSSIFGAIFSHNRALAAGSQDDPFGVTQYGYPLNDPALATANQDPESYWSQNCSTDGTSIDWSLPVNKNWQDGAKQNGNTGQYENDTTDPCLLIQSAVGSAGAIYDTSLLTMNDLSGSPTATSSGPSDISVYKDPFRDVEKNGSLVAKRVDQGVDYGGSGPVYALGNGKVINKTNFGWAVLGGPPTFIVYQLTDGPAAGKYVYVAENCIPSPSISAGDTVTSSTVLCNMVDASPHIETGWADGSAIGNAMAHDVWNGATDNEQNYTAYGLNFSQLLQKLGAPAGTIAPGATELGSLQAGWPSW